ncbi:MAG: radical SAM protein [Candidatus Edwardsbacteria bacterium]|nr:radical SAM protein [Candidatus Edwardsbacteria bacterium]
MLEPIALEYIAAAMEGYDIRIIDMRLERRLEKFLVKEKPAIVGFTGFAIHVNQINRLSKKIKEMLPNTLVLVGGHHATVRPEDFDTPYINLIVMGEGCSAIRDLIKVEWEFENIDGIGYLKDGKRVFNKPRVHPDLDDLPFPRRDLVEKYKGKYHYDWHEDCAIVRSSVGCPFRCSFCALWGITDGRYLTRDIRNIVRELKGIKAKAIYFTDDESMIDPMRMMELARLIKQEGIKKKYYLWSRTDSVVNNPDLFKAWKEIGLEAVIVGYESYAEESLRKYNKQADLNTQQKATRILQDLGIMIIATFIVDQDYTAEDFSKLKQYVQQQKLWQADFQILTPFPGSSIWENNRHVLITNNWDYWDIVHTVLPTRLSLDEYYKKFYWLVMTALPFWEKVKLMQKYSIKRLLIRFIAGILYRLKGTANYRT